MTARRTSTDGSPADALALLKQVLAHPHPEGAAQWQSAAGANLVDAMPFLIQLASGDDEAVATARAFIAVDRADDAALRTAAIQCLRRLYLNHVDDPYRVLGLNPWAGEQQVRDRYRKLIRLFHPDRGALHDQADTALAANLNLAYASAGQQRQGGATAAQASHTSHTPHTSASASAQGRGFGNADTTQASRSPRRQRGSAGRWLRRLNPLRWIVAVMQALGVFRMRPATVWASLVLLGAAVLASAWWSEQTNEQRMLVVVEHDRPAVRPIPPPIEPELPAAASLQTSDTLPTPPSSMAVPIAAEPRTDDLTKRLATERKVVEQKAGEQKAGEQKAGEQKTVEQKTVEQKTVEQKTIAASTTPPPTPSVLPAASPPKLIVAAANVTRTAVATATSPAAATPPVAAVRISADQDIPATTVRPFSASADEIERFIAYFLGSYADGDLDQLLALMQENMSYDTAGGKAAARRAYQRLFQTSSSRDLILRDVVWNRYGERMVASPRFEERVTLRTTGETQSQKGVMHIELIERGGKITIGALSHKILGVAQ